MALEGHDGHPVLDENGNIVYHKVLRHLFGENTAYFNNSYRRNSKFCVSVPCFSKNVYAINFYSYEFDQNSFESNSRYRTYGMGFDLFTTTSSEKVESFRFDYKIPIDTHKWTYFPLWQSKHNRKEAEAMVCNIHYMMNGLKDALDHLKKFHNLVFTA